MAELRRVRALTKRIQEVVLEYASLRLEAEAARRAGDIEKSNEVQGEALGKYIWIGRALSLVEEEGENGRRIEELLGRAGGRGRSGGEEPGGN